MKLNMIFIVMDLLTLLIYPLVFMHGRLRHFIKESILLEKRNHWLLFRSH